MPPTMCLPQIHACAMRVTDLEADGVPLPGDDNVIVSDSLVKITIAPVFIEGTDITDKNGCGDVCLNYKGRPSFRRGDVTIEVCTHDPWLEAKLSGGATITSGEATGATAPSIGPITGAGVSIEFLRSRINDGDRDPDFPYAWWVLPKAVNLKPGNKEASDGNPHPTFTGELLENVNWFDGPGNDWPAASDRAWQWIPVAAPPFVASCGPSALAAS